MASMELPVIICKAMGDHATKNKGRKRRRKLKHEEDTATTNGVLISHNGTSIKIPLKRRLTHKVSSAMAQKRWRPDRRTTRSTANSNYGIVFESKETNHNGAQQQEDEESDSVIDEILEQATTTRKISYRHRLQLPREYAAKIAKALKKLPPDFQLLKLKLRNCGISNEFLTDFLKTMGKSKIHIPALDLSGNQQLDMKIVEEVRSKLRSEVVDLGGIELNQEQMEMLGNIQKLKVLKLGHTSLKGKYVAKSLAKLINGGLEELLLADSQISDQDLEEIATLMEPKIALNHLDLSHVDLNRNGVGAVWSILGKTDRMKKLRLSNCGLTGQLLMEIVKKSTKSACLNVASLSISSNSLTVDEGGVKAAAELANELGCDELDISNNDLTDENIEELLSDDRPMKVRTLSIGENCFRDWSKIAQLVKQWEIKNLHITECRMNTKDTTAFSNSLGDYKLDYVDMRHWNAIITAEKKEALKDLKEKTKTLVFGQQEK